MNIDSSTWKKIGGIGLILLIIVYLTWSCSNMGKDPVSTIQWDIRKLNSVLGYGTKYVIGEVERVSCSEQENDGKGRYVIRCSITYYPKTASGATLTISKMTENIYAIFMRNSSDNFSRVYTSFVSNSFKNKHCWGMDKSKGLFCSN